MGVVLGEVLDDLPGVVGGAVIHEDDLVAEVCFFDDTANPSFQFGERFRFIEQRYNDRQVHLVFFMQRYTKKGKLLTSHRYNRLPLLPSGPGGFQQELVV